MNFKRIILILSIFVLFSSLICVSADDNQYDIYDIQKIIEDNNASDMTGCCSVILQQDGANSIMSFRRDAESYADIYIEKLDDWHGKQAIKQYKTSGGYFCQVIITSDGWIIGYGGIDDGPDNEKIENITGGMINENNTISEDALAQIQSIKEPYKLGHVFIKAPNGNYGIATDKGHFTGKLNPGEYISMPNRYTYFRSGNISANTTDKIEVMNRLAITDAFGLTRRDVTTFNFQVGNETNVTDVYISNDDGSTFGMSTGGLADNVNFTGTIINAGDIPIAPNYKKIGNITFDKQQQTASLGDFNFFTLAIYAITAIIIGAVIFVSYHTIMVLRYRKYKR